ncbi:MAG TPA: HAMP domain-containing protein [Candidatus Aminicenantes bacterium]|nr:HAMP domain-containing protein [Candidatus Aminicenantes bacterium]
MSPSFQDPAGFLGTASDGNGGVPTRPGPGKIRRKMILLAGLLTVGVTGLVHLINARHVAAIPFGAAVLAAAVAFAVVLSGVITRPIVQMTRTAEKLANGDLRQRARVYDRDEVGLLAQTFNAMVDGLERTIRDLEARNRALEEDAARRAAQQEADAAERARVEKELRLARLEIDRLVDARTAELARANDELHGKVLETRRSEDYLQSTLDRLERSLDGAFRAMAMTLELRDPYMAGHQRRTADLAVAIAQEMNMAWDAVEGIRFAAVIHDIGKVAAPAEIMTKPGVLTPAELQLFFFKQKTAYEMIRDIAFPWPVAHIVLQHHERLDGSGYPEGLVGDAILPEARVLAVADVVEAACSPRPHRPPMGIKKALEEVRRGRGILFDARAVDACARLFREGRFAFKTKVESPLYQ